MIHGHGHGGDSPELKYANAYKPKMDLDFPTEEEGATKMFPQRMRTTPRVN